MIYTAKTKDNEVFEISDVQVAGVEQVDQETMVSLRSIDVLLTLLGGDIEEAQKTKTQLETQRAAVLIEAEKVKLKVKPKVEYHD